MQHKYQVLLERMVSCFTASMGALATNGPPVGWQARGQGKPDSAAEVAGWQCSRRGLLQVFFHR